MDRTDFKFFRNGSRILWILLKFTSVFFDVHQERQIWKRTFYFKTTVNKQYHLRYQIIATLYITKKRCITFFFINNTTASVVIRPVTACRITAASNRCTGTEAGKLPRRYPFRPRSPNRHRTRTCYPEYHTTESSACSDPSLSNTSRPSAS